MSSSHDRLKLVAKRGNKPSDLPRNKQAGTKHNYKDQINTKKERNIAFKGLKRRLSSDVEVSNKKTRPQTKNVETVKNLSSTSKDGKNLATNRLARLREGLKEAQSSSQPEHKVIAKKSSHITNQRQCLNKQVTTKSDHKLVTKKTSTITSQNIDGSTKSDVKSTAQTSSNFRIPIKKSINERFKLARECDPPSYKTEYKATVISGSPENRTINLKRTDCGSGNEGFRSPLKRSPYVECVSSDQRIGSDSNRASPNSNPETSFRLSNDYIVISEASSKQSTPANHRLTSLKNSLSSDDSDKTLTPGSPVTPPSPTKEKLYFKTPLRASNELKGLKVPLNRGLLGRRIGNPEPAGTNIFRNVKIEEPVNVPPDRRRNIFGAQARPTIFRNYASSSGGDIDNIFATNMLLHNNNIITPTNTERNAQRSVFGATFCQKSVFADLSAEIGPSCDMPVTRVQDPHLPSDTYRPVYPSESRKIKIGAEKLQKLPRTQNSSLGSIKSATDRLARIRNEGCNTYRKNQASVPYEEIEDNRNCSRAIGPGPVMGFLTENPLGAMMGIQEFEERHDSDEARTCATERLTRDWLETHRRSGKDQDMAMSDSMLVNVNDTIWNKSELLDPVEDLSMEWDTVPQLSDASPPTPPLPVAPTKENIICVVTDTNVFMHSLHKVKDAINFKISGAQKMKIYVPWMVLKELDHLKDHSSERTKSIALAAQRFINKNLAEEDSKIIGQSVQEVSQQQDIGKCPDDKILACCMQAKEKYETVILLTNDINLRNAATFNDVLPCTPQEIQSRLKLMTSKRSKFCKISTKLVALWSEIICDCCKDAYGEAWRKMAMLQNPPWSMVECVKRFKRYWGSVFRVVLLKHCEQPIDGIYNFLLKYKDGVEDDTDEFKEFTKLLLGFMFFLQDLPNHKNAIKRALKEIEDIMQGER